MGKPSEYKSIDHIIHLMNGLKSRLLGMLTFLTDIANVNCDKCKSVPAQKTKLPECDQARKAALQKVAAHYEQSILNANKKIYPATAIWRYSKRHSLS